MIPTATAPRARDRRPLRLSVSTPFPVVAVSLGEESFGRLTAHVEDARAYKERFAERVTVVVIARASHAVIAEQPDAVSAALISYARGLWPDEAAK